MNASGTDRRTAAIRRTVRAHGVLIVLLAAAAILAFYRLPESPPMGYDEGILLQMAANASRHGAFNIRTGPDTFTSGAYMSTGFPALAPVALSLRLFDMGLWQARVVMVVFLFALVLATYVAASEVFGRRAAILSTTLLVTHASLYAYGKAVMGEIPGLTYFMLFLIGLARLERRARSDSTDRRTMALVIITSLALGLTAITKPVFLLALPAAALTLFLYRKRLPTNGKTIIVSMVTLLVCGGAWLATQFSLQDNARDIFLFYRNPYLIQDIGGTVAMNLKRLLTEGTPLYVTGLYAVWTVSLLVRVITRNAKRPTAPETCAWIFGVLILAAYLRTPGFYRYFFYANIVAIFAFPAALEYAIQGIMARAKRWNAATVAKDLSVFLTLMLVASQGYRLMTTSYIRTTYTSTLTTQLERYFSTSFESWREPYVYDVPEIPPFLNTERYTQYIEASGQERFAIGPTLREMLDRKVQTIIPNEKRWSANVELFSDYRLIKQLKYYVVAERIE